MPTFNVEAEAGKLPTCTDVCSTTTVQCTVKLFMPGLGRPALRPAELEVGCREQGWVRACSLSYGALTFFLGGRRC